MTTTLTLIASFALGVALGMLIAARINAAAQQVKHVTISREKRRQTGVVAPNGEPSATELLSEAGRSLKSSGVVRPRLPKSDQDPTESAIAAARRQVKM